MVFILLMHVTHITTFFFAAKSNINRGIISTIFSSSCIFTFIIFYIKYGQKITKNDAFGTFFILVCVALISLGGSNQSGDTNLTYLILALVMAVLTGLNLSLNTVHIQYVFETGFDIDQSNYDGNFYVALLYIPFVIAYRDKFSAEIYGLSTMAVIFGTLGVIFFCRALKYGNAGPVQAIDNTKTIVQSVLANSFLQQIPNTL